MKTITIDNYHIRNLIEIIQYKIYEENKLIKQAEEDEKNNVPLILFDSHAEVISSFEGEKQRAKELLIIIQKQTGIELMSEDQINRL